MADEYHQEFNPGTFDGEPVGNGAAHTQGGYVKKICPGYVALPLQFSAGRIVTCQFAAFLRILYDSSFGMCICKPACRTYLVIDIYIAHALTSTNPLTFFCPSLHMPFDIFLPCYGPYGCL